MILFNFSHRYFKLANSKFTTIRSTKYAKKHNIKKGDTGWITLEREPLKKVKVVNWKDKQIKKIPLKILKEDASYPGFEVDTRVDFVRLLNSFTPFKNTSIDTIKRIFYLEEVDET